MQNESHNWSQEIIVKVWCKGNTDTKWPADEWRFDKYGTWMRFGDYGNRNSKYGWEIDHIIPKSRGGSDGLSNLEPLQWQNNVKKSDGMRGL